MTPRGAATPDPSRLVLSTFTGAGLLDRGFREAGFCVVSAGDAQFGQPIEEFHAVPGVFAGVIGGPPCQKFSIANRTNRDVAAGIVLVHEFLRVVEEAEPDWYLMENVNGLPLLAAAAAFNSRRSLFSVQRIHLNARELGFAQNRQRWYVFGYRTGQPLVIPYVTQRSRSAAGASRCCIASEGSRDRKNARSFADFCELQGLPRTFEFPRGLSRSLQYRLVGNGVHVGVARVIAGAIAGQRVTAFPLLRMCVCECGREVPASRTHATVSCRKRMERRRDAAASNERGPVTPELSL